MHIYMCGVGGNAGMFGDKERLNSTGPSSHIYYIPQGKVIRDPSRFQG